MPWSHTAPADAARTSTAARLKQMSWALGVLSGVAVAVAFAALVPLLAGADLEDRARTQLFIVLFPAALAFGALIGLVLVQRRAR